MASDSNLASKYYKYDFFTGANVGLYIHDTLIVSAVAIEFQLVQNKVPIYGYADQLWSGYAKGNVQCGGNIMLNFQHPNLLSSLIARAQGVDDRSIEAFIEANSRAALDVIKSENGLNWSQEDINASTNGGVGGDLAGLKALDSYAKNQLSQYYWGAGQSKYQASSPDVIKSIRRADDHTGTFDIYITYGDYMGGQLRNVGSGDGRTNAISETTRSTTSPQRSTLRRLSHVVITGIGSTITVAGEPVLESYPFICREVR
jgi:hypothetical protein